MILDPHTKRPKTKRPSDKTFQGQNVPREKMSQGTKRPKGTNEAHYLTWCGQLPNLLWPDKGMT